jgi:uncharacterized protein
LLNLIDCLTAMNKWWVTGNVDSSFFYKRIRSEFSTFVKQIANNKIIAVLGPHGCGKTTLFYHTVDYLLKLDVPPVRVLMLNADEPSLAVAGVTLQDLIKTYTTALLNEEPDSLSAPVYVFIEDIFKYKNWALTLRRFYDKGTKLKFFISAPARSLLFFKDAPELTSRCLEISISPLSPQQFIEFSGVYRNTPFDVITYKSLLPRSTLFDNPREYVSALLGNIHLLTPFRAEKSALFREYMVAGGYPGYFGCDSISVWQHKLLGDIIDLGLYHDILTNFNVKSPEKLKMLLYLLAAESGKEQAFAEIGKRLSLNTVTIINYLAHLSDDRLIAVCENYSGKKLGVSRKNKKIYVHDGGIKNALLRRTEISSSDLEDEVKNTCIGMASDFVEKNAGKVCFWHSGHSEADIVLDKGFTLLPISVNLKNVLSRRDIRGLNSFGRTYFNRDSVVITRDTLAIENNVYYVPYWLI